MSSRKYTVVEALRTFVNEIDPLSQFHQHFNSSFFVQKCFAQLLCVYSLGFYVFFGERKLAQNILVKCWWNWSLAHKNKKQDLLSCLIHFKNFNWSTAPLLYVCKDYDNLYWIAINLTKLNPYLFVIFKSL